MIKSSRLITTFAILIASASICLGQERFYASSDRFTYSGTVSVYNSLPEAQSEQNARFTGSIATRLGSLFVVRNVPSFWTDFNGFLTAWYLNGGSNPFNTNNGFVQLYDDNADQWQNQKAYWHKDRKTFTVVAKGKDATYGPPGNELDYARFWNAGAPAGSGESTKGTFLKYDYSLTAVFQSEATNDGTGLYVNNGDATTYSGHFRAIFRNDSVNYPASNGFYVIDMTFSSDLSTSAYDVSADAFASKTVRGGG